MGLKNTPDELAAAMAQALAAQQNEELTLVKAQLAVEKDKTATLERKVAVLQRQLKDAEMATEFVKAFQTVIQPLIPEPVLVPVMPEANGNGKAEAATRP